MHTSDQSGMPTPSHGHHEVRSEELSLYVFFKMMMETIISCIFLTLGDVWGNSRQHGLNSNEHYNIRKKNQSKIRHSTRGCYIHRVGPGHSIFVTHVNDIQPCCCSASIIFHLLSCLSLSSEKLHPLKWFRCVLGQSQSIGNDKDIL